MTISKFNFRLPERYWETTRYTLILALPMLAFGWYGEWTTVISLLLIIGLTHLLSWGSLNQNNKGGNNND